MWGFGKALAWEAPQLQPRMIDLDPLESTPAEMLAEELLDPTAKPTSPSGVRIGLRRDWSEAAMSRGEFVCLRNRLGA